MVILVLVGGVIFRGHCKDKKQLVKRFGSVLKTVSANGTVNVDGAGLDQMQNNNDARAEAFVAARSVLERLRDVNGLASDAVYILRPSVDDPATYHFVVMLQKKTFIGDVYKPPAETFALYTRRRSIVAPRWLPLLKTTMVPLSVGSLQSRGLMAATLRYCRRIFDSLNMWPNCERRDSNVGRVCSGDGGSRLSVDDAVYETNSLRVWANSRRVLTRSMMKTSMYASNLRARTNWNVPVYQPSFRASSATKRDA